MSHFCKACHAPGPMLCDRCHEICCFCNGAEWIERGEGGTLYTHFLCRSCRTESFEREMALRETEGRRQKAEGSSEQPETEAPAGLWGGFYSLSVSVALFLLIVILALILTGCAATLPRGTL